MQHAGCLAAMVALDLVFVIKTSGEYEFKHALVRDALYQSLLTEPRAALHLKIAEEIESRNDNRLVEVAEALAHHYVRTDRHGKAFAYLAMAGEKSFGVYSLEEAERYFAAALELIERVSAPVDDSQVVDVLISYAAILNMKLKMWRSIDVVERHKDRIERLGEDPRVIIIRHHYVVSLLWNTRFQEAQAIQNTIMPLSERLGDPRARAYALAAQMLVTCIIAPMSVAELESGES